MMSGITTEIQSAGGGYGGYGGFGMDGGFGNNPLLWLITLGFLKNGGGLGGDGDGSLLCLKNGQDNIIQQQQFDRLSAQMDAETDRAVSTTNNLAADFSSFSRDLNAALCHGFNDGQVRAMQSTFDLSRQLADCCCDVKSGLSGVETAICNQTNILTNVANQNTQNILDTLTSQRIQQLESDLNDCKTSKVVLEQTQAIISAINSQCGK